MKINVITEINHKLHVHAYLIAIIYTHTKASLPTGK